MSKGKTKDTNIAIETEMEYKSLYNPDTFKDSFRLKTFIEYSDSKIRPGEIIFLDINNMFLEMNRHFILSRCNIKEFQPRWTFRPNYLSYDEYGTTSFSYLLMFINDVTTMLDFKFDYVKVPMMSVIKDIIVNNQRMFPDRSIVKDLRFL